MAFRIARTFYSEWTVGCITKKSICWVNISLFPMYKFLRGNLYKKFYSGKHSKKFSVGTSTCSCTLPKNMSSHSTIDLRLMLILPTTHQCFSEWTMASFNHSWASVHPHHLHAHYATVLIREQKAQVGISEFILSKSWDGGQPWVMQIVDIIESLALIPEMEQRPGWEANIDLVSENQRETGGRWVLLNWWLQHSDNELLSKIDIPPISHLTHHYAHGIGKVIQTNMLSWVCSSMLQSTAFVFHFDEINNGTYDCVRMSLCFGTHFRWSWGSNVLDNMLIFNFSPFSFQLFLDTSTLPSYNEGICMSITGIQSMIMKALCWWSESQTLQASLHIPCFPKTSWDYIWWHL
jgi:hypothetical protein